MKLKHKLMLGATALTWASTFAGLPAAYAANNYTVSGTSITNNATLDYKVGTVSQPTIDTSSTAGSSGAEFKVDRRIDVSVTLKNTAAPISVTPGQTPSTSGVTAAGFTVINNSNDTLKFSLAAENTNGASVTLTTSLTDSGAYSPTDVGYTIYKAANQSATAWDPVNDTVVTATDALAPDATELVWVVATVPTAAVDADIIVTSLLATAEESDGSALKRSTGAAIYNGTTWTDDSLTNKNANQTSLDTVMTLLADTTAGVIDGAKHGDYSVYDAFKVVSAKLSVNKYVAVHWDPINKTSNPKAIPGAYLEYCIVIKNTGTTAASTLSLADAAIPSGLSYVSSNADDGTDTAVGVIAGNIVTSGSAATSVAGCTGGTAISGGSGTLGASPTAATTITSLPASQWAWVTFFVKLQ